MIKPDSVLFDLDGTLIDTAPDFVTVLNMMLSEDGKKPLDYSTIRAVVSDGARALIKLGFGVSQHEPSFAELRTRLLALYSQCLSQQSTLFPGIDDALLRLESNGIPWGIVTNKPRAYAAPLIRDLELQQRCAVLVCPDDVQHAKPHPEPIFLACAKLQASASNSIYVGDHRRDVESGRNAGCVTIACSYGYIPAHENPKDWGADFLVDHANDLIPLVTQL